MGSLDPAVSSKTLLLSQRGIAYTYSQRKLVRNCECGRFQTKCSWSGGRCRWSHHRIFCSAFWLSQLISGCLHPNQTTKQKSQDWSAIPHSTCLSTTADEYRTSALKRLARLTTHVRRLANHGPIPRILVTSNSSNTSASIQANCKRRLPSHIRAFRRPGPDNFRAPPARGGAMGGSRAGILPRCGCKYNTYLYAPLREHRLVVI